MAGPTRSMFSRFKASCWALRPVQKRAWNVEYPTTKNLSMQSLRFTAIESGNIQFIFRNRMKILLGRVLLLRSFHRQRILNLHCRQRFFHEGNSMFRHDLKLQSPMNDARFDLAGMLMHEKKLSSRIEFQLSVKLQGYGLGG